MKNEPKYCKEVDLEKINSNLATATISSLYPTHLGTVLGAWAF